MPHLIIKNVRFSQSIANGSHHNEQLLSIPCICIELSDGTVFKGDGALDQSDRFNKGHQASIMAELSRLLQDQPADDFFTLCRQIGQPTYKIDEWRYPERGQETGEELLKKNRRDMLSIFGVVEQKQPEKVLTTITYQIPQAIIRGVTAALLQAVSHSRQVTVAQLVGTLIDDSASTLTKLRLGLDVSLATQRPLLGHASALCYTVPAASSSETLGKTGEKFQKYLRELSGWIDESWSQRDPADRPWLYVDLNGTVHQLNNHATGKTLGSLFGFSTTGNQEKMIFSNAISYSDSLKTIKDTTLLQSLVKSRKLKLRLAAGSKTNTVENIKLWLEKCKPKLIVLHESETANLGEWLQIVKTIKSSDTDIILVGSKTGNQRSWNLIHTIAAVANPHFYIPAGGQSGFMQAVNDFC